MLKLHMDQIFSDNQSTKPTNYAAGVAYPLKQYPLPEPALDPGVFAVQESHPTPDTFSLPGRKNHFLFTAIRYSKGGGFIGQTDQFLVASTSVHSYTLVLYDCYSN